MSSLPKVTLPPSSSAGVLVYAGPCTLYAIMNASTTAQAASVQLYDAATVATVSATSIAPFTAAQPASGADLDKTFGGRGLRCDHGLVAIPTGALNNDGGITVVFDNVI